jgi:hypothetical protein
MAPRVKPDISTEQFKEAILTLENGGTKKSACEILGINYNTTRLDTLIEEHLKSLEVDKKLRKQKRGTAISDLEITTMAEYYFEGDSLDTISRRMYRSVPLIKHTLERAGAMLKSRNTVSPLNPPLIPEECIEENFELKEKVWVSGYNCLGEIDKKLEAQGETTYRIFLLDRDKHRFVYYPWYELGSLRHLEALGLSLEKLGSVMPKDERDLLLRDALRQAKMSAKGV